MIWIIRLIYLNNLFITYDLNYCIIKTNIFQSEGSDWLSKWSQGLTENPDNRDNPSSLVEQVPIRKVLPNVNRMRVVNSQIDSDSEKDNSAQNDLNILKKLFGNNANGTKSV